MPVSELTKTFSAVKRMIARKPLYATLPNNQKIRVIAINKTGSRIYNDLRQFSSVCLTAIDGQDYTFSNDVFINRIKFSYN